MCFQVAEVCPFYTSSFSFVRNKTERPGLVVAWGAQRLTAIGPKDSGAIQMLHCDGRYTLCTFTKTGGLYIYSK